MTSPQPSVIAIGSISGPRGSWGHSFFFLSPAKNEGTSAVRPIFTLAPIEYAGHLETREIEHNGLSRWKTGRIFREERSYDAAFGAPHATL